MSKEYKVGTLMDISRIPEDALPRFMAELPDMLNHVRHLDQAFKEAADAMGAKDCVELTMPSPIWVDDGETFQRISLTLPPMNTAVILDTFPKDEACSTSSSSS